MKFYKKDRYYFISNVLVPENSYLLVDLGGDNVEFKSTLSGGTAYKGPISGVKREDGTSYESLSVFLNEVGSFFAAPSVSIAQSDSPIDVYNPLFVLDGAVSATEVDISNSDYLGWEGVIGQATVEEFSSLFKSPFSAPLINNSESPKYIDIALKLTRGSTFIGLGANSGVGFRNVIVKVIGSAGVLRTVVPESLSDGYENSYSVEFEAEYFNTIRIEFNTDLPITISNITIQKVHPVSSQIKGKTDANTFRSVGVNNQGALKVDIARDVFGNLSVADQFSIWDSTSIFAYLNDLFYTEYLTGNASITHQKESSSYLFSVGVGEIAARQLKTRTKYQPLKAHKSAETALLTRQEGVKKWAGYADLDNYVSGEVTVDGTIQNGVAIMVFGELTYVQLWNNGVQTLGTGDGVERVDWNVDVLDGAGGERNPSNILLDLNYAQIVTMEMEWLGVGSVLFYLNIKGVNVPIHRVDNANFRTALVYMRTANLSPFWKIEGVTSEGTLNAICNAIVSGGGHNPVGVPRVAGNPNAINVANNATEAVVFIRLKPEAYEAIVDVVEFGGLAQSTSDCIFRLHYNPAWSGTAITWLDVPNSHIQVAYANGDNIITDSGIVMGERFVSANGSSAAQTIASKLRLGKELQDNAPNQPDRYDVIALSVKSLSANEIYLGSISYVDYG